MTEYLHLIFMDIYHIEHVYGATLSIGSSEDKNSYILAYNSGLEQDMKFKLSPLSFSQSKDYSCIPLMCFIHDFNFSWKSLPLVLQSADNVMHVVRYPQK